MSHEQIGGAFVVWLLVEIALTHIKNEKEYLGRDIPVVAYTIVTFAAFVMAPGNWARKDTYIGFSQLTLLEKIMKNFPKVIDFFSHISLK